MFLQEESGVPHVYDLYALVNHIGSLSGGHYYADIKSFENQKWYRFDDSIVEEVGFLSLFLFNAFIKRLYI